MIHFTRGDTSSNSHFTALLNIGDYLNSGNGLRTNYNDAEFADDEELDACRPATAEGKAA